MYINLFVLGTKKLSIYMQNFNSSQKSCQNEIAFEKNEIFRSSEIFLCQIRDSVQANNKVSFFGKSFVQKNYGPSREQFVKVETSSKETSKISTKNFSDDFKNSLMKQGMCTSQSLNSNSAFNFLISTAKSDILKNLANSADEKTNNPNIRSKEIICINNDGHAIKQKDEFCCEELKKSSAVVGGDCDPNDNIINIDKLNCEMYDINDNANDKINIQVSFQIN